MTYRSREFCLKLPILYTYEKVTGSHFLDQESGRSERLELSTMMTRFCGTCMADVGLDPLQSRLALPGCKSPRLAFCAGANHNCTVTVDELGAVVRKASDMPTADYSFKTLVARDSLAVS